MTDFYDVESDLKTYFDTQWAIQEPTVPVLHDNEPPFGYAGNETTEDLDERPNPRTGEWVRLHIQVGEADPGSAEIGCRGYIQSGRCEVLVFTPLGTGASRAYEIASKVRNVLQGVKINSRVRMKETSIRDTGASPDNQWFVITASTRFMFDSNPAA